MHAQVGGAGVYQPPCLRNALGCGALIGGRPRRPPRPCSAVPRRMPVAGLRTGL